MLPNFRLWRHLLVFIKFLTFCQKKYIFVVSGAATHFKDATLVVELDSAMQPSPFKVFHWRAAALGLPYSNSSKKNSKKKKQVSPFQRNKKFDLQLSAAIGPSWLPGWDWIIVSKCKVGIKDGLFQNSNTVNMTLTNHYILLWNCKRIYDT